MCSRWHVCACKSELVKEVKTTKKRFLSLIPLFFLMLISPVYAEQEDVNLLTLHQQIGERLGVGTFAGGLIASAILLMMTILPLAMINRSRKGGGSPIAELFMGIVILGVCVAITWFPVWIFVLLCFLTALMFSDKITGVIGI